MFPFIQGVGSLWKWYHTCLEAGSIGFYYIVGLMMFSRYMSILSAFAKFSKEN